VRVDAYPTHDGKPVTDLGAADFQVSEDGVPQKIETFEHVVVRSAGPEAERIEPNSQRDMLQAIENPRHRVFVIFLDPVNVDVENSHAIAEPLIRLINRILGPDDLVGVMTPDMSATELVLSRRTEVTEERLRQHWMWSSRFAHKNDDREEAYLECFMPVVNPGVAAEMIARKRERETLEALQDLVRYLNSIREERKAILTVTQGWNLFTPNQSLLKVSSLGVPSVDPVGVGPNGKLTTKDPRDMRSQSSMECEADRMRLANIDDERFLRDIVNEANRSNATFYPINPKGLAVFETDISAGVPLNVDAKLLRSHQESMRSLADGTDGIAVMNTNDLDTGLRRISDDLTSYYLLGYYSTNPNLDGGYRTLKVRVTRPGVAVRARRGYRAPSAEEVSRARSAAAAPAVDVKAPLDSALNMLAQVRPDSRIRLRATSSPGSDLLWIAGEVSPTAGRSDEWSQGARADLQVSKGGETAVARITIKPGERAFLTSVKLPAGAAAATEVQARISPSEPDGSPATDAIHVAADPQPLFYRRGPTTGNRQVATADPRFTRAERVHLEVPAAEGAKPAAGRLLDRTGQPLAVPVTMGERADAATGQRWITADVILAPLAPADYVVEIGIAGSTGESRILTGIRVIR
jgi:VWFA-related protein